LREKYPTLFDLLLDETNPWETLHEEKKLLVIEMPKQMPASMDYAGMGDCVSRLHGPHFVVFSQEGLRGNEGATFGEDFILESDRLEIPEMVRCSAEPV